MTDKNSVGVQCFPVINPHARISIMENNRVKDGGVTEMMRLSHYTPTEFYQSLTRSITINIALLRSDLPGMNLFLSFEISFTHE